MILNNPSDPQLYIGLMSGTSMDGIDAALVEIIGSGLETKLKILSSLEYPYPAGLKDKLSRIISDQTVDISILSSMNYAIGEYFGDSVVRLLNESKVNPDDITAIGSHGQTIWHDPEGKELLGRQFPSTSQIGEPAVINAKTGIKVVSDFRANDIAMGGQGAPLIPYFDYIFFRSDTKNILTLNLGGIANITFLPANSGLNEILAFDTGPANILIDQAVIEFYGKECDDEGMIAASHDFSKELLDHMMNNEFIHKNPPKSTGREDFGLNYLSEIVKFSNASNITQESLVSTLTEFTAASIFENYVKFIEPIGKVDKIVASGGGTKNNELLKRIGKFFRNVEICVSNEVGIASDIKEAAAFAFFAAETLCGNSINIPSVTGALKSVVCGKITG